MSDGTIPREDCPAETRISQGDVIFLLGAGASVDAGIPSVAKLTCELRKRLPDLEEGKSCNRKTFPALFDAISKRDPLAGKNYERFFEWIQLLIKGRQKPFRELTKFELEPRLVKAATDLAWVIADPIRDILREKHQEDSYQPGYLAKLGKFVPNQGRLDVFTTNYDLCVEEAFTNQKIDVTTGFCQHSEEWLPSLFFSPGPRINLYKLHGSLNWYQTDGVVGRPHEVYPPVWEKGKRSELVLGPALKLQSDDPFTTLYSEFHRAVRKAKVCVAIGCGFQDEHIRKPLEYATKRPVCAMTLLNVGPEVPDLGCQGDLGFEVDKYFPIKCGAKAALSGDHIWDKVHCRFGPAGQ